MSDEERKTFGYKVAVPLSELELKEAHEELLQLDVKIDAKESEKSLAMSGFNEDLKTLRAARKSQMSVCTSKSKAVEIAVYEEVDERRGHMITRRADNGVMVSERALTADELNESKQGDLFGGKSPDDGSEVGSADTEPPSGDDDGDGETDEDLDKTLAEYEAAHGREDGAT